MYIRIYIPLFVRAYLNDTIDSGGLVSIVVNLLEGNGTSVLPRGLRRQGALRLTNVLPIARYAFNSVRYALALFFRCSSTRCLRRAFDLTTQQLLLY